MSLPLAAYSMVPSMYSLIGKFIIPEISNYDGLWFIAPFMGVITTSVLEIQWSGVGIDDM